VVDFLKSLGTALPVYVTRPTADGRVAFFTVAAGFVVLIEFLLVLNMVGWGVYGLVELFSKVV